MKFNTALFSLVTLGFASSAFADNGTINFEGLIVQDSCVVAVSGGTSTTLVTLPTVEVGDLQNAGDISAESAPFKFDVTGCDDVDAANGVSFQLSGTYDADDQNLLANSGAATKVGIELLEDRQPIAFAGNTHTTTSITLDPAGDGSSKSFIARYKATGAATAGTVSSSMNWQLIFN